jgi:hypothetical protein
MEKLTETKKQLILNDINIVEENNKLILIILNQVAEDYQRRGKINYKLLKLLHPYYIAAKNNLYEHLKELQELEEKLLDREKRYGLVPLKDPQARERVRNAVRALIDKAVEVYEHRDVDLHKNHDNQCKQDERKNNTKTEKEHEEFAVE